MGGLSGPEGRVGHPDLTQNIGQNPASASSATASSSTARARGICTICGPSRLPGGALFSKRCSTRIGRRLARAEQTMRVRIARDALRRLRELTLAINRLEREITELVAQLAPQLLAEPGFGPLIAATLVGEIAGARASRSGQAGPRRGVAPIPASSGNTQRHRLDRGGNHRQTNAALHRVIVTRARCHQPTRLHRHTTHRTQEHSRSDPLPQAPPRPPRLAPPPTRPTPNRTTPPINHLT